MSEVEGLIREARYLLDNVGPYYWPFPEQGGHKFRAIGPVFRDCTDALESARRRIAELEAAAKKASQHCPHACVPPCPFDRAMSELRAALGGKP